ncbi:MAG TPA: AbrB family transcriptional regulator [Bacillota bacterium]|nr:AbrB family transcriptional regulator [Bacillota bacterium]
MDIVTDLLVLMLIALGEWVLFSMLHLPTPSLLGPMVLAGSLRFLGFPVPFSPAFLTPLIQIVLGYGIGARIDRHNIKELRTIVLPALVVIAWVISLVGTLGIVLTRGAGLDPYTAILSSCTGGLPEMAVLSAATEANISIVVIMQSLRLLATIVLFPVIFEKVVMKKNALAVETGTTGKNKAALATLGLAWSRLKQSITAFNITKMLQFYCRPSTLLPVARKLAPLAAASLGGFIFSRLGIPAGFMVGSMFVTILLSVLGIGVIAPSSVVYGLIVAGVGITVSDNITRETFKPLASSGLLLYIVLSTLLILASSILVAYLISRIFKWSFATGFLAAAPGGFTTITTLAIAYKQEPFKVSMTHLCRLMVIEAVIPLLLMYSW